jgi:DNA-nicking Smr family endonuclease
MRRLADEEKEMWARVVATVRPLRRTPAPLREEPADKLRPLPAPSTKSLKKPENTPAPARLPAHHGGLDGSWDRRLARGLVRPDVTIDLHGHKLATAYDVLDHRLAEAIAAGARLVLLITGKPPRDDHFPVTRGAIRASIDNWLRSSRHAPAIAAVRGAHPRHGGAGALYLVLRRSRP